MQIIDTDIDRYRYKQMMTQIDRSQNYLGWKYPEDKVQLTQNITKFITKAIS